MAESATKIAQPVEAAERAMYQALQDCGRSLCLDEVAVAACHYPRSPRQSDPGPWEAQSIWAHRANALIYPASVMKLFLLAALADARAAGRMDPSAEDDRAAAAMIRESSNEATAYLMGRLTGAEDGGPLPPEALADWCHRRAVLQDWFRSTGRSEYESLQLMHATYQDSPYGRAFDARRVDNGNAISAVAGAALMHDIARGALAGSDWMLGLLDRTFQRQPGFNDPEGDQVRGFLAEGLPSGVKVWSKAGHTSKTRHDLLFAENPDGSALVLSVMTEGAWTSGHGSFLPAFARHFHASSTGAD